MRLLKPYLAAILLASAAADLDAQVARDGQTDLAGTASTPPAIQVLSAASATAPVSAGAIVAIYGANFANATASAATVPLPTELGGVSADFDVADILGQPVFKGAMPLFYVSPTQINAQIPANALFPACNQGSGSVYSTSIQIITTALGQQTAMVNTTAAPAPGLFAANETGIGVAAAQFVTNLPDGTQTITDVASCPGGLGTCVPVPLNVAAGTSALVLWGTGISEYSGFPNGLTVLAGNRQLQVFYAGPSPQYVGLDQINVWMPSSLDGLGIVDVSVVVSGTTPGVVANCAFNVTSNAVTIEIQ
ncbi:MAG: hypothetical protein ACLP59_04870 [Bryobacteraceae bacterium]